ncbi:methyltransferase family protein [Chloroflexota bacterium]
MSLIPAFEIGAWNLWIFLLAFLLFEALPLPLLRLIAKREMAQFCPHSTSDTGVNLTNIIWGIILLLFLTYTIFLPLQLDTAWFYAGLAIFTLGVILATIHNVNIASTPTDVPITTGLYRYSRHPIYLTTILRLAGMGIASASWIFLLLPASLLIGLIIFAGSEEHETTEQYGDAYREYINRTPRWIGIPKS